VVVAEGAAAQSSSYTDVPDRFRIDAGGFRIGADTELTFSAGNQESRPVDFESLDVPENVTRFYVEAFYRPWRRHEFSASYYRNAREGDPRTLSRDIVWGDRVIHAGASAAGRVSSNYFSGVYRFAAYKNERFEIGPALGVGHLQLEAGISGQGTATTGSGSTTSAPFDISKDMGQITGDVGVFMNGWALRRLQLRGDFRYIIVKPENAEASVTDARASALYYLTKNVGIGLQYTYSKFRYDRDVLSTELGGRLRYSGGQLVLSGAF
jgi:hypothetical protein